MVDLNFRGIRKARVELFDLESSTFTRTYDLDRRFRGEGAVWHVVADELVRGGRSNESIIQREWTRGTDLWNEANFAILNRSGQPLDQAEFPPRHRLFEVENDGSSLAIRNKVFHHQPIGDLVVPEVDGYIRRHRLYQGVASPRQTRFRLDRMRRTWWWPTSGMPIPARVAQETGGTSHEDPGS